MLYSINLNLKTYMNMKTTKYILTIVLALVCVWSNSFAVDQSYYSSIDGKSGKNLFDAVHSVAKTGYKSLSYNGLWTAYCAIDLNSSGKVWDMYSNATSYNCGGPEEGANYTKEGDAYNREHSIPKNWFGGSDASNTPGTDLFHVVPTDGYVNNMRSAYAFGEVASASYTSKSGCKKGSPKSITISNSILNKSGSSEQSCSASTVFEPMDEYKGDFARGYFGTMIRWANGDYQTFTTAEGAQIFNTSYDAAHYYGLKAYGVALLLKWHREDPVSQKEIDRNNGIQARQGNRNPFIDYPELVEYIWGEHSGETVTLASLTPTFEGYTPPAATTYTVILSRNGQLESITGVSGTYNLPNSSDPACEGWTFAGWSTTKVTSTTSTPSMVSSVTSGCTVYAVYSKSTPSSAPKRAKKAIATYNKVSSGTITDGQYLIVYEDGSVAFDGSLTTLDAANNTIDVTVSDGVITGDHESSEFTIGATDGTIQSASGKYIGNGSNSNGLTSSDSELTNTLSIDGSGNFVVESNGGAFLRYNSASNQARFRYFKSSTYTAQQAIQLYKKAGSGGAESTTYDSEPEDCNCSGNLGMPVVTATPSDKTITLTWPDVTNATNGYTVTISKGTGYTTECGETVIGEITQPSIGSNECIISGLVNGLEYTASVVANATATTCESVAGTATETPVGCESWANPTFTYSTPLTAGGGKVTPTIGAGYGTPTFISSNTSVLQVDEDGKVTPISAGTATITAHWPGDGTHCPKDVVSNTITVKGIVVLTFNANDGSETPATTTQNFTYGEAQNLTANTFSRTGYTFQGWATSPSGSKEYDDGASLIITAATTLYAVWQANKHSVTFSQPASGGTFTVNSSSSSPVTNVDFGSTVTITITPTNSHFTVNTVSVSGGSGYVAVSGSGNARTFTMPDEDVTVSVTMIEETKYTVNWYVNGNPTTEQNYAGEELVGIANPSIDCNGKAFQGWTATANYSSDDTAPGDLFTDASTKTMPTGGTNYYAVFATESTSGSSKTYNLELNGDNFGSNYNERSSSATANEVGGTGTLSVSFTTTGVMKSTNAGNPIQFRKSGSGAGVLYNTTDLGTINSITYGSGSTNNIASTYKGATEQPTSDGTGGYFKITNGSSVSYLTSITINFTKTTGGGTTYSDYTTSCAAPTEVTVTFHANYEGADPATATQNIPYNTATALTANSFSRTGYTFQGWATSASGSKEYNDEASVTLTSNIQLYAVWQKNSHNVIFTPAPTGATVTVNGQSTSPQSVEYGATVTIVITPDATYDLSSVSATGVSLSGEGNTRTFTMPDADVTVTVIMTPKPTYTIQFFDNGTKVSEQNVVEGQAAVKPADPTPCDGYSFVGWWTETLADDNTTEETWVTNFTATQDQDYYAVFRHSEGDGGSVFDNTTDGDYKIFALVGSTKYYATGTVSGGKIFGTTNEADATEYTFTKVSGGWTIQNGTTYITYSSSSNLGTSISEYVWTISTGEEGTWRVTSATAGRAFIFRAGTTEKFGGYSTGNVNGTEYFDLEIGGSATTYFTTSCSLCSNTVTLTKGAEENGTFTLNKDDGEYNNCTSNFVVTVSGITPAEGYYCSGVTATGGDKVAVSDPDGSGNYTVTYTKGNSITSTIKAIFAEIPSYTVTWDVAGTTYPETHHAGVALEGITAPTSEDCDGLKVFVGWTETPNYSSEDTAPADLFTDPTTKTTPDNNTTTYYAVFAEEDSGSGEIVKATSIAVGDIVYLVYEEDLYELSGISTTSTKYGIGTHYSTIPAGLYPLEVVEGNDAGRVAFKHGSSYLNLGGNSNSLSTASSVTANSSWTVSFSSGNAVIANVAISTRSIRWNSTAGQERFACYVSGGQEAVQLYKSTASHINFTTTCGAAISARNIGWITAAQGQKVKRVINVSAKGFDEATTLSATSGDAQFKVTLGASNVPAGKSGLSTTLTVEYTPTVSDNRVANVEIVLSAGGITKTITVSGRSLPDEFLAITKKNDTWYALPANMTGGENQYEGVAVTPDNDSEPTMVAVAPSTIVYGLRSADNSRYAENGAYVRLAGNGGKALWGNTTANAVTIQNSEAVDNASTENYEWLLTTTDGIHYTIANPHHADYSAERVLAFGDKFGLYKTSTVFFLVPAGCSSQPQEINVSARRADATFSWVSNASSVTIDLYTDEEKTISAGSATATSVPYYMTGLEESTHYWFKITPDGETACAVSDEFETTGPTIDVVEWKEDTVVIFVDKDDEFHPSIVIDGEVEHGAGATMKATELFFSKYFEGSGDMKLVAIFNGTPNDISLANYSLYTKNCAAPDNESGIATSAFSGTYEYPISALGTIKSGQEIVFFTRPLTTGSQATLSECSEAFLNEMAEKSGADDNPRWIECNNSTYYGGEKFLQMKFNGNDAICLAKDDALIDVIGSTGDPGKVKNCANRLNDLGWAINVKNIDYGKTSDDESFAGLYEASSKDPISDPERKAILEGFNINLDNEYIDMTTARCILFRDKLVTSGAKAVALNTGATFTTCGNHTYETENYKSEWNGRAVCMTSAMQTAAGVNNDSRATCNSYQDLGKFDYSEYYKDWTTIDEQKLDDYIKDPETGTYEIPIPDLSKYSCLNLRFQLKNDAGEVVTEDPVQVPIIVTGGHQTIDAIFNEIMKTDGGDPLYDESIERCQKCDVVVLSDGVLTKATDGSLHDVPEVGNVKVYPGGKLIVPDGTEYTINSLAFRRQEDEVATANIQGDLNIKAAGNNVYLDLRVDPSEWHYIALPYNCNVVDIRFAGDEMKIPILGTDYLLKYYDGEKRAATQAGGCWEMVAPDATLRKGIGYIFGIPGEGKVKREFRFPMSNTIITEEKDPEGKIASGVYAFGGDKSMTEVRANHRGWNLIGDPYLLPYSSDIADPVMTGYIVPDYPEDPEAQWDGHYKFADDARSDLRYIVEPVDNGRSEYRQVAITDYEMKPFTSYFVQIGGSNPEAEQGVQFNFSKVDRSASPVRRAPAEYAEEQEDTHPVWCAVTITSPKGEKDETTMLISDQFTDGYDMMDDLVKMRGTYYQYAQITTKPVLASRNNEGEMAFNALPDASAEAGIPLHYFAATQGEYVIAYSDKYGSEEIQAVMLLDKQLNEWHDLMNEPYTFYTNRTDDKDRFVLTIRVERKNGPQITTDIDAASSADDRPRKILHKDHIYILRGDKIYDITGKEMLNR